MSTRTGKICQLKTLMLEFALDMEGDNFIKDRISLQTLMMWLHYAGVDKTFTAEDTSTKFIQLFGQDGQENGITFIQLSTFLFHLASEKKWKCDKLKKMLEDVPSPLQKTADKSDIDDSLISKYKDWKLGNMLSISQMTSWCKASELDIYKEDLTETHSLVFPDKKEHKKKYIPSNDFLVFLERLSGDTGLNLDCVKRKLHNAVRVEKIERPKSATIAQHMLGQKGSTRYSSSGGVDKPSSSSYTAL